MSKLSLPRRYWHSLACMTSSRDMPASAPNRAGYRFWQRYWASFIVADLPARRPAAVGEATASMPGSERSASMLSIAERPLPDVLVLDRVNDKARGLAVQPLRARFSSWSAPVAAAAAVLAIVVGLALVVPAGISRVLPRLADSAPAWSLPVASASNYAVRPVYGTYSGLGINAVPIPLTSLEPSLAAAFGEGRTAGYASIVGFEFRNSESTSFCLSAVSSRVCSGEKRRSCHGREL